MTSILRNTLQILLVASALLTSGCKYTADLWESTSTVGSPSSSPVEEAKSELDGEVELSWVAPSTRTTYYVLRYGEVPGTLEHEKTIKVEALEKIDHPKHGLVYKYYVRDLDPAERFFFSLQAGNEVGLSSATTVAEEIVRRKIRR